MRDGVVACKYLYHSDCTVGSLAVIYRNIQDSLLLTVLVYSSKQQQVIEYMESGNKASGVL